MNLLLIRHAQPFRVELETGPADPSLTPLGEAQAEAMCTWLADERLDALYVSPLRRARQTAEPLARHFGLEPAVIELLAEFDRHDPVYIPLEEMRAGATEADRRRWQQMLEQNESAERRTWRDDLVPAVEAIVAAHPGGTVAAVCHGGVINAYLSHVLATDRVLFFEPSYCSVNRVAAASGGQRSVVTLNEAPFLRLLPT